MNERSLQLQEFLGLMGLTLIEWDRVEEALFNLYCKMLGDVRREICSITYFSHTSFNSRRNMVDKIARLSFTEDQCNRWSNICKRLKEDAAKRNRVAHFAFEYQIQDSTKAIGDLLQGIPMAPTEMIPRLRPSPLNQVDVLRGRTVDKKDNNITKNVMLKYIEDFADLQSEIQTFHSALSPPSPRS